MRYYVFSYWHAVRKPSAVVASIRTDVVKGDNIRDLPESVIRFVVIRTDSVGEALKAGRPMFRPDNGLLMVESMPISRGYVQVGPSAFSGEGATLAQGGPASSGGHSGGQKGLPGSVQEEDFGFGEVMAGAKQPADGEGGSGAPGGEVAVGQPKGSHTEA